MSSSNPLGSQSNIRTTITTLLGSGIDVSCNLLYKECVDKNNVEPIGCGGGGIISQRNFILAQNNFNLQRTINSTLRRDAFTQYTHDHKNHAGTRFNIQFPSYCDNCNKFSDISNANCITPKLENTFLNKKAYMFRNRLGNVISGQKSAILFGGNTGSGLTRNQQLSNMGKGLLPNGRPGLRFGVQSLQGISLHSDSNIYNKNPNGLYGATITKQVNNTSLINNVRYVPVKIPICKK
tara:strand:- start:40 stop:750 length:711 start_codon:yes stop_codon:yes gene_type:complete